MKNGIRKAVCFAAILCLLPLQALAGEGFVLKLDKREKWVDSTRHVVYYQLEAKDDSLAQTAAKINQDIMETAHIQQYLNLLPSVQEGSAGLMVNAEIIESDGLYREGKGYLAVLAEAEGKMLQGPPSHRYYPMVFSVETGERVSFDALFTAPDGAKAYIEQYLADVVEPQLSTYLENSQLFPVPYESFGFSTDGHVVIYYPHDQLSFLSGKSGAVAFRYSELWDYLDTSESGIAMQMVKTGWEYQQYKEDRSAEEFLTILKEQPQQMMGIDHVSPALGCPAENLFRDYDITVDSGFYPGGSYLETESPELLGTYFLMDEDETYLTGILSSRVDMYGIETGKTTMAEAKRLLGSAAVEIPIDAAAAEMYRVCPGTAIRILVTSELPIYLGNTEKTANQVSLTIYGDENGVVQFIKKSLE